MLIDSISVPASSTSSSKGQALDLSALASLDAQLAAKNAGTQARIKQMKAQQAGPSSTKRKREDTDDEDGKIDDASLKLAIALQQEEDKKADAMQLDNFSSPRTRNSSRPLRPLVPKAHYILLSEEEEDGKPLALSRGQNKGKVEVLDSDDDNVSDFSDESDASVEFTFSKKLKTTPAKIIARGSDSKHENSPSRPRGRPSIIKSSPAKSPAAVGRPQGFRGRGRPPKAKSNFKKAALASSATGYRGAETTPSTPTLLIDSDLSGTSDDDSDEESLPLATRHGRMTRRLEARSRFMSREEKSERRAQRERAKLEKHHPEIKTMWQQLEVLAKIPKVMAEQPTTISRELKPFQLEGLNWMQEMEKTKWGGGLLGDEMGMGKTIQAVSLIMSDYPAKHPSLVLVPPVALMQWQQEMGDYTDGTLKTFVYHGTNAQLKNTKLNELKGFDVILMSYNSLESMFRAQEKGRTKDGKPYKVKSVIHQLHFHRIILDEAHCIKVRYSILHHNLTRANTYSATSKRNCQGMFRSQSRSQMVFIWHAAAKPHRRILFSHQIPRHPPIRLLLLQAMSMQQTRMGHQS